MKRDKNKERLKQLNHEVGCFKIPIYSKTNDREIVNKFNCCTLSEYN